MILFFASERKWMFYPSVFFLIFSGQSIIFSSNNHIKDLISWWNHKKVKAEFFLKITEFPSQNIRLNRRSCSYETLTTVMHHPVSLQSSLMFHPLWTNKKLTVDSYSVSARTPCGGGHIPHPILKPLCCQFPRSLPRQGPTSTKPHVPSIFHDLSFSLSGGWRSFFMNRQHFTFQETSDCREKKLFILNLQQEFPPHRR